MFCVLRFARNRIAYCVEVIKLILQFLNLITGLDVTNTKIDHHKGTVSRDFRLFFALNIRPGPLMNRPKQFRKLFRFCKDIQLQSSKFTCYRRHTILAWGNPPIFKFSKCCPCTVHTLKYFISADCSFNSVRGFLNFPFMSA